MTWRTLALLWAGIVVGGLIGTAATVGVLYHRPGSAAGEKWSGCWESGRERETRAPARRRGATMPTGMTAIAT